MTVKDLLQLNSVDINKLSDTQLKSVLTQSSQAVNSRMNRIVTQDLQTMSTAFDKYVDRGKIGDINKMSRTEILSNIQSNIDILKDTTSTIRGIKKTEKYFKAKDILQDETSSDFYNNTIKNLSDDAQNRFWNEYKKFKEGKNAKEIFGDTNKLLKGFYNIMFKQGHYVKNSDVQEQANTYFDELYDEMLEYEDVGDIF